MYVTAERAEPSTAKSNMKRKAAPYLAEFVGTFVLCFTVGCCGLSPALSRWGPLAVALVLMAMVYAAGPISGGHLNPAVSLSLGMVGAIPCGTAVKYSAVQLVAGISAAACCCLLFSPRSTSIEPVAPFGVWHALLAELVYTFMLALVVSSSVVPERNNPKDDANQFYGLATGLVIVAGGYSVQNISGACFNPAVSLGSALAGTGWSYGFAWTAAELLGSILAAMAFHALWPEELVLPMRGQGEVVPSLLRRCGGECLGTFFLVLTVGLNVTMSSPASALSAAAALTCMVYSLGNLSGGHFNPAVTVAVAASGRGCCSVAYILSQILGAVAAGRLYAQFHAAGHNRSFTYGLGPGRNYGHTAAGVAELVFTCVLAYAVLACTSMAPSKATGQNFYYALAIGSCIMVGGIAIGAVSGGELNPAVSIGMAVASHAHHGEVAPKPFTNCVFFSLWELAGGILATVYFRLTHPEVYMQAKAPAAAPPLPPPTSTRDAGALGQDEEDEADYYEIQVPPGVAPGKLLGVTLPDGRQLALPLPEGYAAGAALELRYSAATGTLTLVK